MKIEHSNWCRDVFNTGNQCDCGARARSEGRVERYDCGSSNGDPCMEVRKEGQWVRYEDIEHLLPLFPSTTVYPVGPTTEIKADGCQLTILSAGESR